MLAVGMESDDRSATAASIGEFDNDEVYVIVLWYTSNGHLLRAISVTEYEGEITALSFHPSGKLLAAGSFNDRCIWFWNLENGHLLKEWNVDTLTLAFSPDGMWLFVAGGSDGLRIWDVKEQQDVTPPNLTNVFRASSIAVDPSGRFLATVDTGATLNQMMHVLDIDTWRTVYAFAARFDRPCFSLNGRFLAVIPSGGKPDFQYYPACLIDLATGKELWRAQK